MNSGAAKAALERFRETHGAHFTDASEVKPEPIEIENPSGIFPTVGVTVLPKEQEKVTAGGIMLPPETIDKRQLASMEGTIVAISPLAFIYADDTEWRGAKPGIGDRVLFARYAGLRQKGADGKDNLVLSDKDLVAVRK